MSPIYKVLFAGPVSAVTLRMFAVWCAERTWHVIDSSPDYDLDAGARLRFARALNVAWRAAHGRAAPHDLMAAWIESTDQRAARTAWFPQRLASRGAFGSAARMAARFACRATCERDATAAALSTSRWTTCAVGYLAANRSTVREPSVAALERHDPAWHARRITTLTVAQRVAERARRIEAAEHARELRRWVS